MYYYTDNTTLISPYPAQTQKELFFATSDLFSSPRCSEF